MISTTFQKFKVQHFCTYLQSLYYIIVQYTSAQSVKNAAWLSSPSCEDLAPSQSIELGQACTAHCTSHTAQTKLYTSHYTLHRPHKLTVHSTLCNIYPSTLPTTTLTKSHSAQCTHFLLPLSQFAKNLRIHKVYCHWSKQSVTTVNLLNKMQKNAMFTISR